MACLLALLLLFSLTETEQERGYEYKRIGKKYDMELKLYALLINGTVVMSVKSRERQKGRQVRDTEREQNVAFSSGVALSK